MFGRLANMSKFAPIWKTSTLSLFEDHLKRKRFAQNFSYALPGIDLDLVTFRGSKIQQLFRRLFASTSKRFIKNPADSGQQKKQILSFLSLLLDPGFNEGKLLKSKNDPLAASLLDSLNNNDKLSSFVSGVTSNKVLYPSISAQVLSNYIKKQMSAPQKLKDLDFRINLKTGISLLALFLLKRSPLGSSIRGLRVVCSGR